MLGALMAGALLLALVTQNTAPPMVVMCAGARSWRMKRYRRRIKTPTMA